MHALTSALQLKIRIAELTLDPNRPVVFTDMPAGNEGENWDSGIEDLVLLLRFVDHSALRTPLSMTNNVGMAIMTSWNDVPVELVAVLRITEFGC